MAESLAHMRLAAGQKDAADQVIDRVKKCGRRESRAYTWAYTVYTRMNDPQAAVRQIEEGIQALPSEKVALERQLMYGYAMQHKNEEGLKVAEEILKANPKDPDARTLKTSLNLLRQDPNVSIKELEELLSQPAGGDAVLSQASNAAARYNLGRAYLMRGAPGDLQLARKQFAEAVAANPGNVEAILGLAQTQIGERDFPGALRSAEAALKIDPRGVSPRLMHTAALLGLERTAEANTELTAILKAHPDQPDALLQLGVIELKSGNGKQAEALAAKAVAANPQNFRAFALLVDAITQQ
jgi:predicted Zn-dependent protease